MNSKKAYFSLYLASSLLFFCASCNREFKAKDYTAYFGGEVSNPLSRYVLLYKGSEIIDSLKLDKNNRFFMKFDSLAPGLYTFKHEPEYQYVYFDKNDSLLVAINSRDFDESIVFSGRGDQKNNFLMEMYLMNDRDRDNMFTLYDSDFKKFNTAIDSIYRKNLDFYDSQKAEVEWSVEFDIFAKASVDFPYYSKKEIYPIIHKIRTGNDVIEKLPKNYYEFRKQVDFNSEGLSDFSPFVKYLSHVLNNMAVLSTHNHSAEADISLKINTRKLDIADTLIKNEKLKNTILNNIAFTYLLEDQNMVNNQKFLDTYQKYSTDHSQKNEITKIGKAIRQLKVGNRLPEVQLIDEAGKSIPSSSLMNSKAVVFFWTENATSHLMEAHKKVLELKARYPDYSFIAINLDDDQAKWKETLSKYNFGGVNEVRSADFEDLRAKWAITKIHRTIIVNRDGTIKNAFTNLFNSDFEENLKSIDN